MLSEAGRIRFSSDVFAAFAFVVVAEGFYCLLVGSLKQV